MPIFRCFSMRCPKYFALSYAWGAPVASDKYSMYCGEQNLAISPTLNDFLRIYRKIEPDVPLWIDALCIDQGNDVEKSYQIPNMRYVYSKAALVIVWLGTSNQDTKELFKLLAILHRANECIEEQGLELERSMCLGWMEKGFVPSFDKPIWKALDDFYRRPWFRRLWVVQETILAQLKIYRCGEHLFVPEYVDAGILWIQHFQSRFVLPSGSEPDSSVTTETYLRIDWNKAKADTAEVPQHDKSAETTKFDWSNLAQSPRVDEKETSQIRETELKTAPGFDLSRLVCIDPVFTRSMALPSVQKFSGRSIPLLGLLRSTRTREASIAKDRVFALLGIADEANEEKYGENVLRLKLCA